MKILITGGTHGMGKGVAKVLASTDNRMHEIIILCRSKKLGEEVSKELETTALNKKVSFVLCDLARLSDVREAINEIQSKHKFLDGIFINAGIGYAARRVETEDGMDSHFQVNYLSQFMLTLNLLSLLDESERGGRIIFNVTQRGEIFWDDMQMKAKWSYINGIEQAMVAKRMFLAKLHNLYKTRKDPKASFIGFQIDKTVWTNQLNIIPTFMRVMATTMKWFGKFISIEKCGEIIAPLFTETQEESIKKSGKFMTWKRNKFIEIKQDEKVLNEELQDRLWRISLELCGDERTKQIADDISNYSMASRI
jgi:hypothetical protein